MSEEKSMSQAKVVELLQGIWGEMKSLNSSLNSRIDGVRDELIISREALSQRIDETNARLESGFARLDQRIDETNVRLGKTNARLDRGFTRMDQRFDQFLVGEHGKEHREFRERITRIEAHTGLEPFTPAE